MIKLITAIAGALAAIAGLLTILYKVYWSPAAKRKKKALEDGKKAVDEGDVSGITSAFDKLRRRIIPIIILLALCGCWQPQVVLHPIETIDIIRLKEGEEIKAPKDGYFISDLYLRDVMEAKVQ